MSEPNRIYLDNAATSWPKPDTVYGAMDRYMRENGMAAGRSTGVLADQISGMIVRLRLKIQQMVEAKDAQTLFTLNATDSLNLAIHGSLSQGDHVVTSVAEHNSVLRPLKTLENQGIITVSRVECDENGRVQPEEVLNSILPNTRLVAVTHGSNVTGILNDIEAIGIGLQHRHILFLVDAAQSLGANRIEFEKWGIDFLAASGHKGLLGPLGTGLLVVSKKGQGVLRPIRQGGTGASSDSDVHPVVFPEGFEAGNLNVGGLVGLNAGVDYVVEQGVERIRQFKEMLGKQFAQKIATLDGVNMIAPENSGTAGIVSFNLALPPAEVGVIMDSSFGIQIRAGYHCASLIHSRIGSSEGCVRISFGFFNTEEDVEKAALAVQEIAAAC